MIRVSIISCLFIVLVLTSCYDEEQFSNTPNIGFVSLEFIDTPTTDSLALTFSFEDGDANFGTLGNDFSAQFDLYVDSEPKILTAANIDSVVPPIFLAPLVLSNVVPFSLDQNTITIFPNATSYPAFLESEVFTEDANDIIFECPNIINQNLALFDTLDVAVYQLENSVYREIFSQKIESEVPALYRERYYNLIVQFERIVNGEPQVISFRDEFGSEDCNLGNFNARVPLFDQDGRSGKITYNMISAVLRIPLETNPFRLRFFVFDRDGNRSNEVVTPTYLLSEITRISN